MSAALVRPSLLRSHSVSLKIARTTSKGSSLLMQAAPDGSAIASEQRRKTIDASCGRTYDNQTGHPQRNTDIEPIHLPDPHASHSCFRVDYKMPRGRFRAAKRRAEDLVEEISGGSQTGSRQTTHK